MAYLGHQSHKGEAESVKRAMELMSKSGFLHTEKYVRTRDKTQNRGEIIDRHSL
jgi:hypothetical protein